MNPMKNYYYNPKTQDLMVFDNTTNEMEILEVLKGIRVITSSEIMRPTDDDGRRTRPRPSAPRKKGERICKK